MAAPGDYDNYEDMHSSRRHRIRSTATKTTANGMLELAAALGADEVVNVATTDFATAVSSIDAPSSSTGSPAGAMSMAAGEYVSVSSQSDVERADISREKQALIDTPAEEEAELASI